MKRHKSIGPMLRNGELKFWTPVNFEVEFLLNKETEDVLTDNVIYLSGQHLRGTWLSQLKPNAKVGYTQYNTEIKNRSLPNARYTSYVHDHLD